MYLTLKILPILSRQVTTFPKCIAKVYRGDRRRLFNVPEKEVN